jgi:REP element-mobilizing transposase RayT
MQYKDDYQRHLPHWNPPGSIFFVTFTLVGAIPAAARARLVDKATEISRMRSADPDNPDLTLAWKRLFKYADDQLDASPLAWRLADDKVAHAVIDRLTKGAELCRFRLHRYCIMPNHVHVLLEPLPTEITFPFSVISNPSWPPVFWSDDCKSSFSGIEKPQDIPWHALPAILRALKGASAHDINRLNNSSGAVWNAESYDHWVRDAAEYARIVAYIDNNPVKAGLCEKPEDFKWSSAAYGQLRR